MTEPAPQHTGLPDVAMASDAHDAGDVCARSRPAFLAPPLAADASRTSTPGPGSNVLSSGTVLSDPSVPVGSPSRPALPPLRLPSVAGADAGLAPASVSASASALSLSPALLHADAFNQTSPVSERPWRQAIEHAGAHPPGLHVRPGPAAAAPAEVHRAASLAVSEHASVGNASALEHTPSCHSTAASADIARIAEEHVPLARSTSFGRTTPTHGPPRRPPCSAAASESDPRAPPLALHVWSMQTGQPSFSYIARQGPSALDLPRTEHDLPALPSLRSTSNLLDHPSEHLPSPPSPLEAYPGSLDSWSEDGASTLVGSLHHAPSVYRHMAQRDARRSQSSSRHSADGQSHLLVRQSLPQRSHGNASPPSHTHRTEAGGTGARARPVLPLLLAPVHRTVSASATFDEQVGSMPTLAELASPNIAPGPGGRDHRSRLLGRLRVSTPTRLRPVSSGPPTPEAGHSRRHGSASSLLAFRLRPASVQTESPVSRAAGSENEIAPRYHFARTTSHTSLLSTTSTLNVLGRVHDTPSHRQPQHTQGQSRGPRLPDWVRHGHGRSMPNLFSRPSRSAVPSGAAGDNAHELPRPGDDRRGPSVPSALAWNASTPPATPPRASSSLTNVSPSPSPRRGTAKNRLRTGVRRLLLQTLTPTTAGPSSATGPY